LYAKLKSEGKTSANPLKESFAHKTNLKMVLLALFGATMGQGVIWYTGQFYAQSFLENVCRIEFEQSRTIIIWAILFATPFFVVFGSWSDKIGRKRIMMAGMLLGILFYRPIFQKFLNESNINLWGAKERFSLMDLQIKSTPYKSDTMIQIIKTYKTPDGNQFTEIQTDTSSHMHLRLLSSSIPAKPLITPPSIVNKKLSFGKYVKLVFFVFVLILFVTMVYGPIAAFLVEMFPTKIRYTSMSLPYHIGNGVFGGLTPFIATLLTTIYTGDQLVGLWYSIIVAMICFVIGALYITNKIDPDVND
jgi:MFS family permease